jgi:peptidyl-prolyl cis-trans isomerase B (cyclophilin B)
VLSCAPMRNRFLPLIAVAVVCGGCGSSARPTTGAAGGPQAAAGKPSAAAGGCHRVAVPAPKAPEHLRPPHLRLDPARTYTVHVRTNCGSFAFALDVRQSPAAAASMYYLVKRGFYDGLTFHRVAAGFVIQGGDPVGNGTGGPGYTIVDPPPAHVRYATGDVAMAKTEAEPAGAAGSQFFIVTAPTAAAAGAFQPVYALAGRVVSGISVVQAIGRLATNPPQDGAPEPPVVMSSVTVSTS